MSKPKRSFKEFGADSPWLKMPLRRRVAWATLYLLIVTALLGVPAVVSRDAWTTAPLLGLWGVFVAWIVALAAAPAKAPRAFLVAAAIYMSVAAIAWLVLLAQPVNR